MKKVRLIIFTVFVVASIMSAYAQSDSTQSATTKKKYQAKAPKTQPFGKEAFSASKTTTLRWLSMTVFLINSRGTTMMVDPLLKDFDMPVMIDFPIKTEDVHKLDPILVTNSDNDRKNRKRISQYSAPTLSLRIS